ncbi:MAG TPA: hypothetical protein VLZ74_03475 [Methylocella sp.]|nr:hypothetical protein [Methylocella sp.]
MREFAKSLLLAALTGGLCCTAAMAEDLSVVGQWEGKYPLEKIANDKPLWDQPGVQAAMRAAMGEHFFALSQKATHGPEAPVTSNGKGVFVAWSCTEGDDCSGNNMTVFLDSSTGNAQVCWRGSDGIGGKVQDVWLANGTARPLPINGCGVGEKDPFSSLKKFGSPA